MGEHMLNALLQRLSELKQEYEQDPGKELTYTVIMTNVYDVVKKYTVDRREILSLFGGRDLSYQDLKAMKELDYE